MEYMALGKPIVQFDLRIAGVKRSKEFRTADFAGYTDERSKRKILDTEAEG